MKETGNTAQCFINMWWRISSICFSLFYFRDQSCVLSKNKRKISYFVKCIDFLIDGVTPMRGQHKPTIIHDSTTEKIFSNTQNVMVTCLTPSPGDLHWEISEESNSFQDPWSTESQPGCFWKRKKTVYILFSCSADSRKRKENYTAIWSYFFFCYPKFSVVFIHLDQWKIYLHRNYCTRSCEERAWLNSTLSYPRIFIYFKSRKGSGQIILKFMLNFNQRSVITA